MRRLFLFLKAFQPGLFDQQVQVSGHATKTGKYVAPYQAKRKKRHDEPQAGDLFAEAAAPKPAEKKPEAPAPKPKEPEKKPEPAKEVTGTQAIITPPKQILAESFTDRKGNRLEYFKGQHRHSVRQGWYGRKTRNSTKETWNYVTLSSGPLDDKGVTKQWENLKRSHKPDNLINHLAEAATPTPEQAKRQAEKAPAEKYVQLAYLAEKFGFGRGYAENVYFKEFPKPNGKPGETYQINIEQISIDGKPAWKVHSSLKYIDGKGYKTAAPGESQITNSIAGTRSWLHVIMDEIGIPKPREKEVAEKSPAPRDYGTPIANRIGAALKSGDLKAAIDALAPLSATETDETLTRLGFAMVTGKKADKIAFAQKELLAAAKARKDGYEMRPLKKSATITEPAAELIGEHRRLVRVLRSPSHEDDLKEADDQEAELREYEKKAKRKKRLNKAFLVAPLHQLLKARTHA